MKLALLKMGVFVSVVGSASYYVVRPMYVEAPVILDNLDAKKMPTASSQTKGSKLFGHPTLAQKNMVETSLNVTLKGVMTSSIPDQAMAVLLIDGREEKAVFISEEFAKGVSLHEVNARYVVINRQGELERLSFPNEDQDVPLVTNSKAPQTTNTDIAHHSAQNGAKATQEAKVAGGSTQRSVPPQLSESKGMLSGLKSGLANIAINQIEKELQEDGEKALRKHGITSVSNGYQVTSPNAMLEAAGVKVGDTILSVNGTPVSSLINNPNAIQAIKQQGNASILIKRNNQSIVLNYTF
jgi:type II secretory pathway component PulC